MGDKLKKQEMLKLIDQLQIVQKMPRQSLEELCRVFKVGEQTIDISSLTRLFKDKICDIICQEGDTYMDYLQLPRFRSLKSQEAHLMFSLFRTVWDDYAQFSRRQKVGSIQKQIDDITPTLDSLKDVQHFHLNLLQIYRGSSICPRKGKQPSKNQAQDKAPSQTNHNFLFPNPSTNNGINPNISTQMGSPMYPYFSFPPQHAYPKVEVADGGPYIVQNKQNLQGMFQYPRLTMVQQPSFYPNPNAAEYYIDQKRRQQFKQYENKESVQKYTFGIPFQLAVKRFTNFQFIQCACEGKKGHENKDSFKCVGCEYQYHASCLSVEFSSDQIALCPLCILRKESLFCRIVKEPVKFNWYARQNVKGLKLEMTMEESQRIHEFRKKGYSCQIRFLKIEGRQFGRENKLEGESNEQSSQRAIKHTQILLPQLPEDKNNPISLQILLRSNQTEDSTKLYFFAVFLITFRRVDEIIAELFASDSCVGEDYYDEWRDSQGKVEVNLIDSNFPKGLIHFPVRGANCKHADVFDFKSFLQGLKKDSDYENVCPICSGVCSSFKYDKILYNCIDNCRQYDVNRPITIQLKRGGEYVWVQQPETRVKSPGSVQNGEGPKNREPIFSESESVMDEDS